MPTPHSFYVLVLATVLAWPFAIAPFASLAATPDNAQEGTPRYTVQTGDTVSRIAKRFGLSADALLRANDLQHPDRIAAGYVLRLPVTGPNATTLAASSGSPDRDRAVPTQSESAPRPATPPADASPPRTVITSQPQPKPFQSTASEQAAPDSGTKGANTKAPAPSPAKPPRNDVAAPAAPVPTAPVPTAPVPAAPVPAAPTPAAPTPAAPTPAAPAPVVPAPAASVPGEGAAGKNGGAAVAKPSKNGAEQAAPSAGVENNNVPALEPETTATMQAQRAVGVYTHPTLGTLRVVKTPNGLLVTKDNLTIPMRHLLYGTYDGSDASGIIHSIHLEFNSRGEVEALLYSTNGTGNITFTKNKK